MHTVDVAALLRLSLRRVQALDLTARFDRQSLLATCVSLPDELAGVQQPSVVALVSHLQQAAQQWQDDEMLPDEQRAGRLHTRVQEGLLTALRLLAG
jgi:hypothetical protein